MTIVPVFAAPLGIDLVALCVLLLVLLGLSFSDSSETMACTVVRLLFTCDEGRCLIMCPTLELMLVFHGVRSLLERIGLTGLSIGALESVRLSSSEEASPLPSGRDLLHFLNSEGVGGAHFRPLRFEDSPDICGSFFAGAELSLLDVTLLWFLFPEV